MHPYIFLHLLNRLVSIVHCPIINQLSFSLCCPKIYTNPSNLISLPNMLFSIATVILFPLLGVCDSLMRNDCWCWNTTHIAWNRHVELDAVHIEGGLRIIDEWCIQETPDRRGYCLDQHTKQYEICASNEAMHNTTRRNDFCYYNHGNNRGFVTHYSEGDDEISECSLRSNLQDSLTLDCCVERQA